MASTRRAMHVLEDERIDLDVASTLVSAQSDSEALYAFSLLRGTTSDMHLVMLANLRELLLEMPACPFRAACDLDVLARASDYEDTGRSYRRRFESDHGVFGLEFVGRGNVCEAVFVHTPASRFELYGNGYHELDPETLQVFANHAILLDAAIDALEHLGWALEPKIYLCVDDFYAEHAATAAGNAVRELF
jgi:hypothetical protein